MTMNVVEKCHESNMVCIRLGVSAGYSFLVLIISLYFLVRITQVYRSLSYEQLPMISCAIQACIHFIFFLLYQDNKLTIISNYVQILTFTFVAQGFAQLYYRLKIDDKEKFNQRYPVYRNATFLVYVALLGGITWMTVKAESRNCDVYFKAGLIIILIDMTFTCCISLVFGHKLMVMIEKLGKQRPKIRVQRVLEPRKSQTDGTRLLSKRINPSEIVPETSLMPIPEILVEIKTQIRIVNASLTFTAVTYLLLIPFILAILRDDFCHLDHLDTSLGMNALLFFICIVQVTPCLAIPYAFYYVPAVERVEARTDAETRHQDIIISQSLGSDKDAKGGEIDLFVEQARKISEHHDRI